MIKVTRVIRSRSEGFRGTSGDQKIDLNKTLSTGYGTEVLGVCNNSCYCFNSVFHRSHNSDKTLSLWQWVITHRLLKFIPTPHSGLQSLLPCSLPYEEWIPPALTTWHLANPVNTPVLLRWTNNSWKARSKISVSSSSFHHWSFFSRKRELIKIENNCFLKKLTNIYVKLF